MTTTTITIPPIVLTPPAITAAAVNEHINALIAEGMNRPEHWERRLALASAQVKADFEVMESGLRLKRALADSSPDSAAPGKAAGVAEHALTLADARAAHNLGNLAAPVFQAACITGERLAKTAQFTANLAELEAEMETIQQAIRYREETPWAEEAAAIEALQSDKNELERILMIHPFLSKDEEAKRLRKDLKASKFKISPTREAARLRQSGIDSEIETLENVIDRKRQEKTASLSGEPNLSDLMIRQREVEAMLEAPRKNQAEARDLARLAERELETSLMVFHVMASGVIKCHELDSETARLTFATQPGQPADSKESPE